MRVDSKLTLELMFLCPTLGPGHEQNVGVPISVNLARYGFLNFQQILFHVRFQSIS